MRNVAGKTLVVVNPVAGGGRAWRVWQRARTEIREVTGWECVFTERIGHAREIACSAARAGYERVVAVGGDGTVSEVVDGIAASPTALAIIPAGTGNDCARNIGVPFSADHAARVALTGAPRAMDFGEIRASDGARAFVNIAGFGFDAEVAWRLNRTPRLSTWLGTGRAPHVVGVIAALHSFRSPRVRLTLDDQVLEDDLFLVAVGNGPSYGGGMRIAPAAVMDDGLFDVCLVRGLPRLDVLRLVPRMYSGGHQNHPAVEFRRCRELTAASSTTVRCEADGENAGLLPARFMIHSGELLCVTGPT